MKNKKKIQLHLLAEICDQGTTPYQIREGKVPNTFPIGKRGVYTMSRHLDATHAQWWKMAEHFKLEF
tara:strand:- start:361 stop:561 length:201 start_codon:yes stop_codon:yes gene_type:complete